MFSVDIVVQVCHVSKCFCSCWGWREKLSKSPPKELWQSFLDAHCVFSVIRSWKQRHNICHRKPSYKNRWKCTMLPLSVSYGWTDVRITCLSSFFLFCSFCVFMSFYLCSFPFVVLQDSTAPDMSSILEWIYNSVNGVLQFLGKYWWSSDTLTYSKQEFSIEGLKKISTYNFDCSILLKCQK